MKEEMIKKAIEEAYVNEKNNYKDGGPFGAVIEKDGKIIAKGHNTVILSKDPTAHAEVNAIRNAAKALGTHDLSGCNLYVNAEPCPMCLSAIIWANIKNVYFANTKKDSEDIGFRDDMIYEFIQSNNTNKNILNIERIEDKEALEQFEKYKNNNEKILY